MANRQVVFGAMAPPLARQLNRPAQQLKHLQRSVDAITWLLIRGVLTDAEGHRARQRLMRAIAAEEQADG